MEYSYTAEAEIKTVISDWARYTIERLQKSIDKNKIGHTGSLRYSLLYNLASMAGDTGVKLEFNYYGKFVDMGVGNGQKIESIKTNREIYDAVGNRRRPKKWLKTLYGEVAELSVILQQKYGQQGARVLKESIQDTFLNAAK